MKSKFPLGIQTFSEIIAGNYLYVDKTALVYELAHYAKYQFLSRPRRFGKSLLVSTLQAYFEGRKELFAGLAIDGLEKEWTAYPVIHIDFSASKYYSLVSLQATLDYLLSNYEEVYKIVVPPTYKDVYNIRLMNIIQEAFRQTGRQVVVLIDEYDAPMHDTVNNSALQKEIRELMRNFFSPLKLQDVNLRFVFITGISKFSQLSIFSELNNLKILTLKEEYATVCGFTEQELDYYFKDSIDKLAQANRMTYDQALAQLQTQYDGYHFSANSLGVYNPYSIINALDDRKFNDYWFSSATPTFLIELLKKKEINMLQLDELWTSESRFDVPTDEISDPIPVLYQSGYLTIKEYSDIRKQYRLGFPNEEVRKGFSESLYRYYASDELENYDALVATYNEDVVLKDDMKSFLPHLKTFYDKFPYTLVNNNERHYQAVLYTIFCMLGADVVAEHQTSNGRIDLLLRTNKSVYIFELKYGKDAGVAMDQIYSKHYADSFADEKRNVWLVGVNFSKDQRTIEDWVVETKK